jgi:MFS family permease
VRLTNSARKQQGVIAIAGVARLMGIVLLGTSMAVYIGREASPFAVSLALTAFHFGLLVFAPVWGAVADITGRRRLVLVATTLFSAFALLPLAFSRAVWLQIGLRWLYAVFAAGFGSMMLTIVSERGGAGSRGRSVGFYNSVLSAGGIGGRVLVGFLLGSLLPSSMYLLVAALSVLAALAAAFVDDPTPDPDRDVALSSLLAETRRRLLPAVDEREHLTTHGLSWLYLAIVLRNMTQKGIGSVLPVFLLSEVLTHDFTVLSRVVSPEFAMGLVLAISPTLRTLFMYLLGRVSDAFGRKPLIATGLAGAGIQAVALAASALPEVLSVRVALVVSGFVVHAITFSALTTGAVAFIGDVSPTDRESELMGLRTTARGVGGVVGPLFVGAAATVWSFGAAFLASSALAFVAAAVVARTLTESRPEETSASLRSLVGN